MIKKISIYLLLVVFLSMSLAACGTTTESLTPQDSNGSSKNGEVLLDADRYKGTANSGDKNSLNNALKSGHKIIFTGEISLETLKFDETIEKITNYIAAKGGYIESTRVEGTRYSEEGNSSLKTATYVLRIPHAKYSNFFKDIKSFGNVISEQSTGEDITDQYFDTEAHLKSLRIQENRLLALLQKASKMSDILAIEKELQSTRYEIESYTGTLRKWDSLISFSSVTVNVEEVEETSVVAPKKNEGLFSRIAFGFTSSVGSLWSLIKTLIVVFVVALPYLIFIGIILLVVFLIMRRRNKNLPK